MVKFIGSLPNLARAISINPQEGSARIQIDVPSTELANVLQLLAIGKDKALRFSVEVAE